MCQDLCVQLCNPYSGSSAIYTVANRSHESVNYMPSSGWKAGTFPVQLGNTNSRPVGVTNRGWLPARIGNNPSSDYVPSSNEWIQGGASPGNQGSGRAAIQGCNSGDAAIAGEFCVPDFSGRKKRWWPEACGKSEMPKSVYEGGTFQDGRPPSPSRPNSTRGLDDQKDAYLQVPIHPNHQKFLVFKWNNSFYQFQCLPFGLSTAPRVFTKLLRPVVEFLRQIGCHLIIYLDNILLLHQDRDQLLCISQLVNQLFQHLGLLINEKKFLQIPCQQMEYLGFFLCS